MNRGRPEKAPGPDGALHAAAAYVCGLYTLIPLMVLIVLIGLPTHGPGLLLGCLWLLCTLPVSILVMWALWEQWSLGAVVPLLFACPPLNFLIWKQVLDLAVKSRRGLDA